MGDTRQNLESQWSVIGSMLRDDRCIPLVLSKMRPEDFSDGTCRSTFRAIRKLTLDGRPVDRVTLMDAMSGGEAYAGWLRDVEDITPTAANVEAYIDIAQKDARHQELCALAGQIISSAGYDEDEPLVRKMSGVLSATSRMPRMTGEELAKDFLARMGSKEKPEYLPWGLPTADRAVYAEMGDMILLGGYPSAGKTLLSILMALTQAKRYKVGYYSLETRPEKMADRMFSHLAGVPLDRIKTRKFGDDEWNRLAVAANNFVSYCPFDIVRASGSSVDDIASDAIGRGYQIVYVDYLQLIEAPGVKAGQDYARVSAVSRGLKTFAQSTNTAVVALAQLNRPDKVGKGADQKPIPPSMQSFRESGQIEQDADAAFLLWASDPDDNQSTRILKLGKNKEGRRFRCELSFDGSRQTMTELEQPPDNSVAAKLSADGRAIKRANRAQAAGQMRFRELPDGDKDNPFT